MNKILKRKIRSLSFEISLRKNLCGWKKLKRKIRGLSFDISLRKNLCRWIPSFDRKKIIVFFNLFFIDLKVNFPTWVNLSGQLKAGQHLNLLHHTSYTGEKLSRLDGLTSFTIRGFLIDVQCQRSVSFYKKNTSSHRRPTLWYPHFSKTTGAFNSPPTAIKQARKELHNETNHHIHWQIFGERYYETRRFFSTISNVFWPQ